MNGFERSLQDTRRMRAEKAETNRKMCFGKKRYHSDRLANDVASKVFCERQISLRVYPCPVCFGYHLTKKENRQ